jgi:hypothetical protein
MARSDLDGSLSALGALSLMCGLTAALFLLLFWLMQPKVLQNPGMASYSPPPGTRLEPPPRKSDAPELAELPPVNSSSAFAEAFSSSEPPAPAKQETRERPKKAAPAKPRRNVDREKSYAQQQQQMQQLRQRPQWGFGYGQQRNGPSWSWF